jgi:hypothetical protein
LLFVEHIPPGGKGRIACSELGSNGNWTVPKTVVQADYHLSYPFLFEWQGQVYLMPETAENQTLELYRAVEFPWRWTLDRVIMQQAAAVDGTIAAFDGRYWLFVNMATLAGQYDAELFLFHADSPLGPWRPHPGNPVVADVRRARPAGSLLSIDGKLIRPSQDCSVRYGYALVWNQVEVLSTTDYRERPVGRLDPSWLRGALCTHTYTSNGEWEAVDVRILASRVGFGKGGAQNALARRRGRKCRPWLPFESGLKAGDAQPFESEGAVARS